MRLAASFDGRHPAAMVDDDDGIDGRLHERQGISGKH